MAQVVNGALSVSHAGRLAAASAMLALAFLFPHDARAAEGIQPVDVDLELILAVDISRSMDRDEQALQRQGYVSAFRDPSVVQAIREGPLRRIAVTYFEWSGQSDQWVIVPWTLIANGNDAEAFAARLAAEPIGRESSTSISSGLFFAGGQFVVSQFRGARRAVDVSGDGPNNAGLPVDQVRDWLIRQGVTINGLPIMLKTNYSFGTDEIADLDVYYEDCVIGGPGAFMLTVDDKTGFDLAIRRKLVLEISGLPPRVIPAAVTVAPTPRIDCQIGEKARKRWIQGGD
jgi:Protein of unknown function (DUF1194)